MTKLRIFLDGVLQSQVDLQEGREFLVGRGESCDFVLKPESGISRKHFKLTSGDGVWKLVVLSQTGEVFLNGSPVRETVLGPTAQFSVPPYEFVFEVEENQASLALVRPTRA